LRDETERIEGGKASTARLVGTKPGRIVTEVERLLNDQQAYNEMTKAKNPYSDGNAAGQIREIIEKRYL